MCTEEATRCSSSKVEGCYIKAGSASKVVFAIELTNEEYIIDPDYDFKWLTALSLNGLSRCQHFEVLLVATTENHQLLCACKAGVCQQSCVARIALNE